MATAVVVTAPTRVARSACSRNLDPVGSHDLCRCRRLASSIRPDHREAGQAPHATARPARSPRSTSQLAGASSSPSGRGASCRRTISQPSSAIQLCAVMHRCRFPTPNRRTPTSTPAQVRRVRRPPPTRAAPRASKSGALGCCTAACNSEAAATAVGPIKPLDLGPGSAGARQGVDAAHQLGRGHAAPPTEYARSVRPVRG